MCVLTLSFWALSETSVTSGVIVFDPPPSNASIVEGETATFTCVPKVNGTVVYVISWIISPVNAAHTSVNIVNTTTLAGADGVFLSGDERHLLITGVQRRLDRTRFTCQGITLSNERSFAPDVYLTVGSEPCRRHDIVTILLVIADRIYLKDENNVFPYLCPFCSTSN